MEYPLNQAMHSTRQRGAAGQLACFLGRSV